MSKAPEPPRVKMRRPALPGRIATRARTASAIIHDELRDEIVSLARKPGEAISEKEIAARYGVSRTPVREALLKLGEEQLVESFPQSGTFVARIPVDELGEAILVRASLEKTVAELVAERRSPMDLLRLEATLTAQDQAAASADRAAFHEGDEAFHRAIATAAGYPNIYRLVQQVKHQIDRFRRLTLPAPGRMPRVIAEHRAVLEAIAAADPAKARTAMEAHLVALSGYADLQYIDPHYLVRAAPKPLVDGGDINQTGGKL